MRGPPAFARANSSAVQSACLTRRMSGVRIPLRPLFAVLRNASSPPVGAVSVGRFFSMRLHLLAVAGLCLALPAAPLAAQLRSSRPPPQPLNLPRLMVANPHSFSSQDSTAAVRIGAGLRDRVERVSDRWYKTLQRAQMNEALQN